MNDKNSSEIEKIKKPMLALSDDANVRLWGSFRIELVTPPKKYDRYEKQIYKMMAELSMVLEKYLGEEGLSGIVINREHIYTANYLYPTIMRSTHKKTFKVKIKNASEKIQKFLGL